MANFTIADIKALREQLGTGMVDTKKALEEADGDVDKATEILRLKGAKGNAKRADRSTSEGLVAAHERDGARHDTGRTGEGSGRSADDLPQLRCEGQHGHLHGRLLRGHHVE